MMPPETPLTKHQIPPDKVLSFFEVDQASKALRDVDFSIHEEVRTLVQLFRDTDASIALRAPRLSYARAFVIAFSKIGRMSSLL